MSRVAPLRRAYAIHGVGVEIAAGDAAVIDAMDQRLRGFGTRDASATELHFEFTAADEDCDDPRTRPESIGHQAAGRPVYDTPYGSLYYFPGADVLGGRLAGVQLRCEPRRGLAVLRSRAFRGRELYLATHPLATIALMELMERRGRFSLHAGCTAGPDGDGVLLSGPSGAGKSTLTLALARAGMEFLGDDVVFLERTDNGIGTIQALGFADTVGFGAFAAERFPELSRGMAAPPPDGFPKSLHRIEDVLPGHRAITRCVPRAIVFPEVAPGRRSEIAPLDRGEALLRLVPDVLLTDPAATQSHLDVIGALLDQVECYAVRSGSDLERAASLVQALVAPDRVSVSG